jgi:leucyl aminopeptidase
LLAPAKLELVSGGGSWRSRNVRENPGLRELASYYGALGGPNRMTPRIIIGKGVIERQKADLIILPIAQGRLDSDAEFSRLDKAVDGTLKVLAQQADFSGRADQVLECTTLGRLPQSRIVLVGLGLPEQLSEARCRNYAAVAARSALNIGAARAAILVPQDMPVHYWRPIAEGVTLGAYRFTKYLTAERRPKRQLETVILCGATKENAALKKGIELGQCIGNAVACCRDAVNEPPNVLTPVDFVRRVTEVAHRHALKIKVLDRRSIDRAGMSLLAAVGRGSANEPRFVHVTYAPKTKARKKIVFLGKGLTFDSGGLCIKPAMGMDEMKNDMAGAAAVMGLMDALGVVRPSVEVHGLFVLAENMPDGNAYRPGDVVGSLDGKTVEIINTDAEGRLALADGLTYARRLNPDLIVDAATLTGACIVALGKNCSAYFTADDAWADRLKLAAQDAGESFWRMPLLADLRDQLKSDIADVKHTGDRWGGSITAALFLKEFVGNVPWIHCDIAGPVFSDRPKDCYPKGATGHPVLTFLRFVEGLG